MAEAEANMDAEPQKKKKRAPKETDDNSPWGACIGKGLSSSHEYMRLNKRRGAGAVRQTAKCLRQNPDVHQIKYQVRASVP